MRFELASSFPGVPSSTPGSCRKCGIGYLRDGETGVVVTDMWIDMEGQIILCEACASELGRLVPNAEVARLEAAVADVKATLATTEASLADALDVIRAQRLEMALIPPKAKPAAKSA